MAIRLVLKKAMKYIHLLCYDLPTIQQMRNTFSQLMGRGMGAPPLVSGTRRKHVVSTHHICFCGAVRKVFT